MDLRYGMRRLFYALILAATVNVLLTGFFCPVRVAWQRPVGHIVFAGEGTEFRRAWRLDGLPLDRTWLGAQAGLSLLLGFGFWFVYPQFRPKASAEKTINWTV